MTDTDYDDTPEVSERDQVLRRQYYGDDSLVSVVAQTVAEYLGVEPTALDPLYYAIDPDLVEKLTESGRNVSGELMFDYEGLRVTLTSDRQIVVARP